MAKLTRPRVDTSCSPNSPPLCRRSQRLFESFSTSIGRCWLGCIVLCLALQQATYEQVFANTQSLGIAL
eukprot:2417143-Amphidinium_carterae.1